MVLSNELILRMAAVENKHFRIFRIRKANILNKLPLFQNKWIQTPHIKDLVMATGKSFGSLLQNVLVTFIVRTAKK